MAEEPESYVEKPKLAYSLKEAAEATGYSVGTLRIAIRRNDLLARYANSRPVILADELQDWLRSLPTEPKGGHQPLSDPTIDGKEPGPFPGPPTASPRTATVKALFRTPEAVGMELGLSGSTVRTYCRTSGIYTRVGKRIMLHEDDVERLVAWIRDSQKKSGEWWEEPEKDPFA